MNQHEEKHGASYLLSTWQRQSILMICFLLYAVNYMDRQVLSVVLEPMKLDLGLTDTQAGLLQTGFFLSMALLAFPAAYLVDRWSRRKALSVMAVIWSCFTFLTGLGKSFLGVLLPRIIVGVGEAGFPAAGTAMISAAYPEESRSRVLGIFNASIPLGAAFGTILGGYLAQKYGSWRTPFYIFAVPGIILGILAFFLKDYKTVLELDETGKKINFLTSLSSLFGIRTLRWLYLGYALQLAMTMAFIVWGPAFLMRTQGIGVAKAGVIMGIIGLMGIVGSPLGGIIADLWQKKNPRGRIYTPMITSIISAVFMVLAIFFDLSGPGFVIALVLGVFLVMGVPAVNSVSQDVASPAIKGIAWGMAACVAILGGASWAPPVVGAISDSLGGGEGGLKIGLMLMAVCGLVAGILYWLASRPYPEDLEKVKNFSFESE